MTFILPLLSGREKWKVWVAGNLLLRSRGDPPECLSDTSVSSPRSFNRIPWARRAQALKWVIHPRAGPATGHSQLRSVVRAAT